MCAGGSFKKAAKLQKQLTLIPTTAVGPKGNRTAHAHMREHKCTLHRLVVKHRLCRVALLQYKPRNLVILSPGVGF